MKQDILISYADEDKKIAEQLKSVLTDRFGETVWIRDFDLNAGDKLVDVIPGAVAEVKWFVLLYSKHSKESTWLNLEADIALWSVVEKQGFELVIVKLDQTDFTPVLISVAGSKKKPVFNLSRISDYAPEFMRLADYIEKTDPNLVRGDIFVDRGSDRDKFSLLLRQNRIIFVIGIAGIGKTAFVKRAVSELLGKTAVEIKLTRGHSLERLSREILQKTHSSQPLEKVEPRFLLTSALTAIKSTEKRMFIFLNYVENALDTSNELLPFLHDFLVAFAEADSDTHIVLATSRSPEIHPRIAKMTTAYQLKGLETPYIQECLKRWTEDSELTSQKISDWVLGNVAVLAGGHPLAARFIAIQLRTKGSAALSTLPEKKRMELKLGSYILETVDRDILSELHHVMLQVLAVVREPMSLEDMLNIKAINQKYKLEELQEARSKLVELLLIDQEYEMMSLNSFLTTYYQDQVDKFPNRQDQFAEDYGGYAYNKSVALKKKWDAVRAEGVKDGELNRISNDVFRYSVAADRLLRMSGKSELISKLPIQIGGTIRDLVIHYYQHKKDYPKALKFAEEWLKYHPDDIDITLFQIRCYRNIEDRNGLLRAEDIIVNLEQESNNTRLRQRLLRERALISEKIGDYERAEIFYRQGINIASINPYPENYIGLAHLLLRKIDLKNLSYFDELNLALEAVRLLETARDQSPVFDRFHLGTYIDALIRVGRGDTAFPLLEDALTYSPTDERLNLRMAEIWRQRGELDHAEEYARKALDYGARKASLTLANIEYTRGRNYSDRKQEGKAKAKYALALDILKGFTPEFGHDEEVRDGIASKIYRERGDWEDAKKAIGKYVDSINPYTIYEQCVISIHDASVLINNIQKVEAAEILDDVILRLESHNWSRLPKDLSRILEDAVVMRKNIEE